MYCKKIVVILQKMYKKQKDTSEFKKEIRINIEALFYYIHFFQKHKRVMYTNKFTFPSLKDSSHTENRCCFYFISYYFYNLGYIGQTRRYLKANMNKHLREVKSEHIYSSSIACHCYYHHYFDFTKASVVSSTISSSYLTHEAFYILKNPNYHINDFTFVICVCLWCVCLYLLSLITSNCSLNHFLQISIF